jgi:hypothetical protein
MMSVEATDERGVASRARRGGLGGNGALIQGSPERPAARSPVAAAPDPAATELAARLDEVERRLAAREDRTAEPAEVPAPLPVIDEARLDRIERELAALRERPVAPAREQDPRFRDLDDAQLRAYAVELSHEPGIEAVDAWYALLRRELHPAERASALDAVANLHIEMKDPASAAAAWGKALETEGVRGTQRAQGYAHSRAWALLQGGDPDGALAELDRLLSEPKLAAGVESSARLAAAGWAYQLGDADRARAEYQAVIDRWGRSTSASLRERADIASRAMANLGLR